MDSNKLMEHDGTITKIDAATIYVNITTHSACSSCSSKSACNALGGQQEKIIEVANLSHFKKFKVGDEVKIGISLSLGFTAAFLGYILPFLIVIVTLLLSNLIFDHEGLVGLLALSSLVPYYSVLYLNKDKFKKKFDFKIQD